MLQDSIASVGLMVALYFGMTGVACAWYFRRHVTASVRSFVQLGLLPLFGGLSLLAVLAKSLYDLAQPANSESGDSWFGVGPPFVIGVGLMALGVVLMALYRRRDPRFFNRRPDHPTEVPPPTDGALAPALSMR